MDFLKLGFDDADQEIFEQDKITYLKRMGKFLSQSRQQSKIEKCYYCEKPNPRFCKSHFVPAFILRNIAVNGEVYYWNTLINMPLLDDDKGVNEAGTFRIICQDCDSRIFSNYENPDNYTQEPSPQMLAQIALKNYLKNISKRLFENAMYNIASEMSPMGKSWAEKILNVNSLDMIEYQKSYEKAKRLSVKNSNDNYYLFYYEQLDYVVPIAFQGGIVVVSDLDKNVINNIYNMSSDYHPKELHVCVFPLQNQSVVMMFIDRKDKRYRTFYKQFRKLSKAEKLAITNYLIFLYSEDVFFSKQISQDVLDDINLIDTSKQTSIGFSASPISDPIQQAVETFDLNNWNRIPNLLDEKYKIR